TVHGPATIRRDVILMGPQLIAGSQALAALAVEAHAIEVLLRGVVRRRREIDRAGLAVDPRELQHVQVAGGDQRLCAAGESYVVDVPPPIALAEPEEAIDRFPVANPGQFVLDVEPRTIAFGEDGAEDVAA